MNDLRFALRQLARRPAFAIAVIITLGLGIGAATAVYRAVDGVLLSRLPFDAPERLVRIYDVTERSNTGNVSPLDVVDWRRDARRLTGIATLSTRRMALTGRGTPDVIRVGSVSANFFDLLGVAPSAGRTFRADEETIGRDRVVVLRYETWRDRLGADPAIVGRQITLDGAPHEIIGVLPLGFEDPLGGGGDGLEMFSPLALELTPEARGGHWLLAFARLADGIDLPAAEAELKAVSARLAIEYPGTNTDRSARLVPLHETIVGPVRRPLLVLLAAVGAVLAVACVNVINLVTLRAMGRRRELAVRTALGASRGAIARQLLLEHALLAVAAGGLGLVIADALGTLFRRAAGGRIPRLDLAVTDGGVLAFTLGITALTVLLFGLWPAIRAGRTHPWEALQTAGRVAGDAKRVTRHRAALVGVQLAVTFVLLTGAGLLGKTMMRLGRVDTGFHRDGILTFEVRAPRNRYPDAPAARGFHETVLERVAALPGVRAAGTVNALPLSQSWSCDGFVLADREPPPLGEEPCTESRIASPGYFAAMGIPLLAGRGIEATDVADAEPVVVVNEAMVRSYWPNESPLGRRFAWWAPGPTVRWSTIVGVVGDVRHFGLDRAAEPEVYEPQAQRPDRDPVYAVRTAGDPAALVAPIRALVVGIDPEVPLRAVRTMDDLIGASVAGPRFRSILLTTFAVLASILAAVGLYGVLASTVADRTREIGVRVALGATPAGVVGLVVRRGLAIAASAVVAGALLAAWLAPLLRDLLFEVSTTDIGVYAAVGAALLVLTAIASVVPASRAARVDPVEALRHE